MKSKANANAKIQFVTDIEGSLHHFIKLISHGDVLSITRLANQQYRLEFNRPNIDYLVCGGDICDRGDPLFDGGDIRIANALIDLKERYKNNVVLLIGNRDANKMRLASELPIDHNDQVTFDLNSQPEYKSGLTYGQFLDSLSADVRAGYKVLNNPITRLQWILQFTMGAPDAFKYRHKELSILRGGERISNEDVYNSFRQSVTTSEKGFMYRYLEFGQIAWVHHHVFYTHGGILDHQIGQVPNRLLPPSWIDPAQVNCLQWVEQLNTWGQSAFERWSQQPGVNLTQEKKHHDAGQEQDTQNPKSILSLCDYATGRCHDERGNAISIITAKLMDLHTGVMNPLSATVATFLTHNNISLLVTGHQPHGDTPSFLVGTHDDQPVAYLDGDTLYSHYLAYDSNDNIAKSIRSNNPRGAAYSVITLQENDANGFSLSIKGNDGLGIHYQHDALLTLENTQFRMNDPHIGRKLSINGIDYIVRLNAPERAAVQRPLSYNTQLPFVGINEQPRYVLSTVEKPFSIRYQPIGETALRESQEQKALCNRMSSRFFQQASLENILSGIELIVFDIDLTVLDKTTDHYWTHLNHARVSYSQSQLKPWAEHDFHAYFAETKRWISREHIVSRMIGTYDLTDERVESACAIFYDSFESDIDVPKLFPGVHDLLSLLKQSNVPLLALSDTEARLIKHMLTHRDVHHHFTDIIGEAKKSESTDSFDQFMQRQSFDFPHRGKHILVIGDSLNSDGKLAQQIGARFIFFIGEQDLNKVAKKKTAFHQAIIKGAIPKDSIVITDYQQLIHAVNIQNVRQETLRCE